MFVLLLFVGAVAALTVTSSPAHVRAGPAGHGRGLECASGAGAAYSVRIRPAARGERTGRRARRLVRRSRNLCRRRRRGAALDRRSAPSLLQDRSGPAHPWSLTQERLRVASPQPVTLAEHGAAVSDGLDVAISGTGVRYVAWQTYGGGWMIATAAPGRRLRLPRALPVPLDQLLASPGGPRRRPSGTPERLGFELRPCSRLAEASAASSGFPAGSTRAHEPLALNDRGAFAVVENTAEDGAAPRRPPHPVVSLCEPAGRCLAPRSLRMGRPPAGL